MHFPNTLDTETQPLPKDLLSETDREAIERLAEKGYEVRTGLTPEFAGAITIMANEPSIRIYCPKDCSQRFMNRETTEKWLSKGRAVFLLLKRSESGELNLAGYGWIGAGSTSKVPGGETTFALRIGEASQSQGLATPFARLIVASSAILNGAKNIWLETWKSNAGAVHVYQKIGFETVAEEPGERELPDNTKEPDTRVYMSLSNDQL